MNRRTVALLTKYLLYYRAVRSIAIDQSFGARNLSHSSAKSVGYFRDPLSLLDQLPHVGKPQPAVRLFCETLWYRASAGNPPDQNSLGMSFENLLLQVLGYTDVRRHLVSGPTKPKLV